ncbi:MAG: hypothetical protein NWT08_10655 [Akkermansiaceae bacterium]|jgi:hypothetical protein|nr:hypothetical protein [Akkermansiaceae bacterium]MDP4647276.1 hypothetical protein [Akkermansiaceae bacterium]MDP4722498.1 hypothetical protein [Akkermansiaceae bacterium]MDP4781056.1 hypothetical protein [Akkermansiaceae bacterium]MDP4848510.1 hypothetical protein [Akkermansiaceae bacterium]
MISGKQLLAVLVGAALGAGGWLAGSRKAATGGGADAEGLDNQLRIAGEEIALLEKENASLRSLAQGGGEVAVPPELIAMVEKDYGLTFLSSPVFHMIASEELGYRVEAAIESRMGPQGVDDRQEAWQRMGLLRKGDKLLEMMSAVRSVGAVGWFDEETGDGWVTDKFDLENIPDQAAALRLLVRILLNQHFPPAAAYPGDDAAWAREALHAGAASGAEARFYAASARGIGFLPTNDNSAAARLLLVLPEFLQGLAVFPAVSGKGLSDTYFVKGTEEFAEGMRKPPVNTFAVVLPGEEPRGGAIDFPEMPDETYLKENLGYLGLRLWVEMAGDVGLGEELAREWVRDGYVLFGDGEMSSGLVWDVELESAEGAGKFQEVARSIASVLAMEEPERKYEVVRISEKRVRFLNVVSDKALGTLNPQISTLNEE